MESRDTYDAIVVTRNGATTFVRTLGSLLSQTQPPRVIIVVDDGSTDETLRILVDYSARQPALIRVLSLPDRGYDIRRVVHNINAGLDEIERIGSETKYTMISGDDCIYPPQYAEYLIQKMRNPALVVASGNIEGSIPSVAASGAGRFIRNSFLKKIGGRFPPYYGYESWILYKALQLGYKETCFNELTFEHLRRTGSRHGFNSWGPASHEMPRLQPTLGRLEVRQLCHHRTPPKRVAGDAEGLPVAREAG